MLNILSVLIGLATLILIVPLALLGALIGMASSRNSGRNFCLIVAAFGALRLFAGGGIF